MARVIYTVNHTQVVVSEANPDGIISNKSGYPMPFDSKNYEYDEEKTFTAAEAEYRSCEGIMLKDSNPSRVMQTITLERSDGRSIFHRSKGSFPVIQPEPEPEEPEEPEGEPEN